MGISRQLLLLEDFDWHHADSEKKDHIKKIEYLGFKIEATAPFIIIIYIGKQWPGDVFDIFQKNKIRYDNIYIQKDSDSWLEKVDFNDWEPVEDYAP